MKFSDSSKLLIDNWDSYQFVTRSAAKLQRELAAGLRGIEATLRKEPWWDHNWFFVPRGEQQCWIGRKEWGSREDCAIWIGVEEFTAENLFGDGNSASTYVWTNHGNKSLANSLKELLSTRQPIGKMPNKPDCYVIQQHLPKLLAPEADQIDQIIHDRIIEWVRFYGALHADFTTVLARDGAKKKT